MKNIVVFPFALLQIFCFSCKRQPYHTPYSLTHPDKNYHKVNFDSLMMPDAKIEYLDFYGEVLGNKQFYGVYDHGYLYEDDAVAFLSKGWTKDLHAGICLCAMQQLPVKDYIKFCGVLVQLYDQNKIDEHTLEYAITTPPSFPHNRIIVDNYDNPEVIKLLKTIQDDKKITSKDFKAFIPEILSGKAKDVLDASDEDGEDG